MKRPKLRKSSKRMSCSKKYRIEKNVKAHNKKLKKNLKKHTAMGKVQQKQKDPGVPNSAPFKESILREAELRKHRAEAVKQRQKEERQKQINRKRSIEALQKDALQRQDVFEHKRKNMEKCVKDAMIGKNLNETSRKSYYKEFKKVVEASDVIIEVLDSRDPLGCRCIDVERSVLHSGSNKRIVLLLNKIDLVPKKNVQEWLKYLRNEFPTVAFKASTQLQKSNLTEFKVPLKQLNSELLSTTSQCVGSSSLLKLLSNYCRQNTLKTSITVGVVGFPNVGKSSVINSLKRSKACNVGSMPGITKSMQEVTLSKNIKILDCPGIVMATGLSPAAVILRNCVKIETLDDPITPVAAILSRCNKKQMMMWYNITAYDDVTEFLELLAKRKGKLLKGGQLNTDSVAKGVLQDWNSGRLSYYTHPPDENVNTTIDAQIVTNMASEFDWKSLEKDNQEAMDAVCGAPSASHSVVFKSAGPTKALIDNELEDLDKNVEEYTCDEYSHIDDSQPDNFELGNIEINTSFQTKKSVPNKDKFSNPGATQRRLHETLDDVIATGRNIQANQKVKELMKQKKRRQKRADKISAKLGKTLENAMNWNTASTNYNQNNNFDCDMKPVIQ